MFNRMINFNKFKISLVLLIALVILIISFSTRFMNEDPLFSGSEFYNDIDISKDLSQEIFWSNLQEKEHSINLSHYILSFLDSDYSIILVSLILGLISTYIFFLLVKFFSQNQDVALFSTILFVISPAFIFLFTRLNSLTISFFFTLIFFYLYIKKNWLSLIPIILVATSNFAVLCVDLVIVLIYHFTEEKKLFFFVNTLIGLAAGLSFIFLNKYFFNSLLFETPSLVLFLTEFGAPIGLSFFNLFLALIGFSIIWKRKPEFILFLSLLFILFLFSMVNPVGRIFFNLFASFLCASAILFFSNRVWALISIKRFTLLLVLCGVLFGSVSYIDQLSNAAPHAELVMALDFLKTQDSGKVISYESNGFLIQHFAGFQSFIDGSENFENYIKLKDVEQKIFFSRNLESTNNLLQENKIKYFVITKEMQSGLVWKKQGEGILFLLENSDSFKEIYNSKGVIIWRH